MGMYDIVDIAIKCPLCGSILRQFQTKDLGRHMDLVSMSRIMNFYEICDQCNTWIEFNRNEDLPGIKAFVCSVYPIGQEDKVRVIPIEQIKALAGDASETRALIRSRTD